jgi:hypothetical protein
MFMFLETLPKLRMFGRLVKWLGLAALALWLSTKVTIPWLAPSAYQSEAGALADGFLSLAAISLASFGAVLGTWLALAPVRHTLFRMFCQLMIRTGVGLLVDFGSWELLSINAQARRSSILDYSGISSLDRIYCAADQLMQARILRTVHLLAELPQCGVSQDAMIFIEVVEQTGAKVQKVARRLVDPDRGPRRAFQASR